VATGDIVRMQALYFDTRSGFFIPIGLMSSNEIWFAGVGLNDVRVDTIGSSSDNLNPDGFFRVTYLGGPAIEKVVLSFRGSNNLGVEEALFDVNNYDRNDGFEAGRGFDPVTQTFLNLPGCDGTYRHDSDLTTGLVYDDTNSPALSSLNSAACTYYLNTLGYEMFTGWIASDSFRGSTVNWQTLEFNFTDFGGDGVEEVFAFDCDTDRTPGEGGGAHAGMVVTIHQAGGIILSAELLPDSSDSTRGFIGW
jgi:hypothetical protein